MWFLMFANGSAIRSSAKKSLLVLFLITNLANKTQTFVSAQTRAIAYSYCCH